MKKLILTIAFSLALPLAAGAQTLTATLSETSEATGSGAAGVAILNFSGAEVRYSVLVSGVASPTAAHVHELDGDVVLTLSESFVAGTATGTATAGAEIATAILSNPGGYYVDVHSTAFTGGAVRGSLQAPAAEGGQDVSWLPVVGRSQGAAGTNFVTDVRLVNTSAEPATVTAEFWASSQSGHSQPTAVATFEVAAGAQKVIDNVTGELFGAANGLGAMRFTSSQPLIVSARINNDLRASGLGTTGFAIRGVPTSAASLSGTIPFLSQSEIAEIGQGIGFRTNLGWFNPGDSAATVVVTARESESGDVIAAGTLSVPARSHLQQQAVSVLPSLLAASVDERSDFYITYQSSEPIFFYGSVVDNKTGDSVYID